MMRCFLIGLCFNCSLITMAQLDDAILYKSYLTGDITSWSKVLLAIDIEKTNSVHYLNQAANYTYGYIAFCVDKKQYEEAQIHIARLEQMLKRMEGKGFSRGTLLAYRSAIAAYQISMNRWKIFSLGFQSVSYANEAFKLEPNDPFILSLKGSIAFFSPAIIGGTKLDAITYYERSVANYEKLSLTHNNWNYLTALLFLAQSYEKTGDITHAKQVCQKLLVHAPNFCYVRDVYYPKLSNLQ